MKYVELNFRRRALILTRMKNVLTVIAILAFAANLCASRQEDLAIAGPIGPNPFVSTSTDLVSLSSSLMFTRMRSEFQPAQQSFYHTPSNLAPVSIHGFEK